MHRTLRRKWNVWSLSKAAAIVLLAFCEFVDPLFAQTVGKRPNTFRAPITQNRAPSSLSELHPDRTSRPNI